MRKKAAVDFRDTSIPMEVRFPMNVDQDTYDSWKLEQRRGDVNLLIDFVPASRPVIDRALKYGNVKSAHVGSRITKFFLQRSQKENNASKVIIKNKKGG